MGSHSATLNVTKYRACSWTIRYRVIFCSFAAFGCGQETLPIKRPSDLANQVLCAALRRRSETLPIV
jgi:hypothetical protein